MSFIKLFFAWIILISQLMLLSNCDKHLEINIDEIIQLTTNKTDELPADASMVTILAHVPAEINKEQNKIVIHTSASLFAENMSNSIEVSVYKTLNINGTNRRYVEVLLISPNSPAVLNLFATVSTYVSNELSLEFIESAPTSIKIESDVFGIPDDHASEALITASLKSENGIPSIGQLVDLEFLDTNRNKFNDIRLREINLESNSEGKTSAKFNGGNLNYTGTIIIKGKIHGTNIKDSTILELFNAN